MERSYAMRTIGTIYIDGALVMPHGDDRAPLFNPATEKHIGGSGIDDRRNDDGRFPGIFVIADRLTKSEIPGTASLSTPEPMMMRATT
jgi:hypothetical protein